MQSIARRLAAASVAGALTLALAGGTAFAQDASTSSSGKSDSVVYLPEAFANAVDPVLTFTGTPGSDTVAGAGGNDFLFDDGGGDDFLFDDEGNDRAGGGTGNDRIMLGVGDDSIEGEEGDDGIHGEEGDGLFGGDGEDELEGEEGDDYVFAAGDDGASDDVEGGAGFDTCVVDEQDSVSGCENVVTP